MKKMNKKQKRILKWILVIAGIIAFILIVKNLDTFSMVGSTPTHSNTFIGGGGP